MTSKDGSMNRVQLFPFPDFILDFLSSVLSAYNITTYIPALNTIGNLGSLFERQADVGKARIMYSKALGRYEEGYGS